MNLSKSRYCRGVQCNKMLWLEQNKPDEAIEISNESVFSTGNLIHEIAKYLFGNHINIEYNDNLKEMVNDTSITIESYQKVIITEASFNYLNNFCSVDILKKNGNNYELYEVKSSTTAKEIYLHDISYQYYVLTNLGLNVQKCYLVHLNNNYIRKGPLDLNALFSIEDLTKEVKNLQNEVALNINQIDKYMLNINEPNEIISINCFNPYHCPFFKYCTKHLPINNVFNISGMRNTTKIKLYNEGKYKYEDLLNLDINSNYKMQIDYTLNSKNDYIDKKAIKEYLNTLTEPLYFLDFETFQMPIPLYDNIHPYEQIPCQYSLHYYDNNILNHKEFIAEPGTDPRRALALRLTEDIPLNVCTLAYNMAFEKNIIKSLANLFPDLKDHLMNIYDNMQDLIIPFRKRYYYSKDMQGSYSIKYVLPALFPNDSSLNYHNLDLIQNGSDAMNNYANLLNLEENERKYVIERLLRYCELDTYAMVKIYEKLKEVSE